MTVGSEMVIENAPQSPPRRSGKGSRPPGRRAHPAHLLALACALVGASAAAAAALGASSLGLFVPTATPGSLRDAGGILANNLEILALLVAMALFQPLGVSGLSSGFLPRWLTDLAVGGVVALNLVAIGGVLGALGLHALLRVAPHAPLELGGFGVALAAYLRARRGELERREAVRTAALATALLACGALVESYVSGALW